MKTPLKDHTKKTAATTYIKSLLKEKSTLDTYCLYAGSCELSIAADQHCVNSFTNSYVVYEFWRCLTEDPQEIYQIISCDDFTFESSEYFKVFQEKWFTYENKYLRSALFFLLNRCSEDGLVSSGDLKQENYNILAMKNVQNFKKPENFSVNYLKNPGQELTNFIDLQTESDFIYVPVGQFTYNLFEDGKSYGPEETRINNRSLKNILGADKKIILHYNYHKALQNFYKKFNLTLIDKYGKVASDTENAQEVIVANF